MNILLQFTTNNYKIWHNLAKRLKEVYPDSRFAGLVGVAPGGEHVLDFLRDQNDINYEFLYMQHDILKKALRSETDHEELRKFEESLPGKSVWRLVASDKWWGSSFMKGAVMPRNYISRINDHDNILRVCSGMVKSYRLIFDEFETDYFLPAISMGSVFVHIFEHLCQQRNIPYVVPTSTRVGNVFAFASDVQLRFPQIDETYRSLMNGEIKTDLSSAIKTYENLMAELEAPKYFDRELPCFKITRMQSLSSRIRHFLAGIKNIAIAACVVRRQKNMEKDDVRREVYDFRSYIDHISIVFNRYKQRFRVLSPGFGEDPGRKYLYYPLHTNPEYSTAIQGTMWMDQVHLIEQLAKSIPYDWVVYVKEHPVTVECRVRPRDFYKRIKALPNVRMAPVDADMHEIIANAEMVAVITGTSGWEAIQRGKPLITFADNFWDVLELSRKCTSIENLSKDIHGELNRVKTISGEERKRRLINFFAAVLEHGFELTYPNQFSYEKATDKELEVCGIETADAFIRHLNFSQGAKTE